MQALSNLLAEWRDVLAQPSLNGPVFFLIIDMLALAAAVALYVIFEGGVSALATFMLRTPFTGPGGALLLFEASREAALPVPPPKKLQ